MKDSPAIQVESISRTAVSTMGDAATFVFNTGDGGEAAIRLPFEVISDSVAALAHAQRALVLKRQALGAGETPNLLHLKSVKARDLPEDAMHLALQAENGLSFHFHVSAHMARLLSGALGEWIADRQDVALSDLINKNRLSKSRP